MSRRIISDIIAGRSLITATPETSVRDACKLMADKRIGAVLVVQQGKTVGIFTERDALNKVLAAGLDPDTSRLSQVMVADPSTIRADKPLAYALLMMAEGGFRHVPVVDASGTAVGMLSARDALGEDLVELEHDIKRMEALESSIGY